MNFESFRDSALKNVEAVQRGFTKPDDDWMPVCVMLCGRKLIAAGIILQQEDKHLLLDALKESFREHVPEMAALILSCWTKNIPLTSPAGDMKNLQERLGQDPLAQLAMDMASHFGLSNDPERTEMIRVEVASAEGDHEVWTADIVRYATMPPSLNKWEKSEEEVSGRFHEALKKAFAASAKRRERKR